MSLGRGVIAALLLLLALPATAQIEARRVQFAPGASSATVAGELQGARIVDYLLNARAGQAANISMAASTGIAAFDVLVPSARAVTLHVGSRDGNQYEGVLPASGDYRVRVYLTGNQALTTYRLEMIVDDVAKQAAPPDDRFLETDVYEVTGVAAGDVLNLRAGPSTARPVLAGLENGTILRRTGVCEAHGAMRWCPVAPVARPGLRGWVPARYLREPGPGVTPAPARAEPVAYPEPDRRRTDAAPPYLSAFGIRDALDIRREPSPGAPVIAAASAGTVLRNHGCREAEGRRWCEVERVGGATARGWAPAEWLEAADATLRAGQDIFDAGGWIDCAQAPGQPLTPCGFGVARDGGGTATVVVTRPDGRKRALFFQNGAFIAADTSQADGYPQYSATRAAGVYTIRVGDERYEVFDAVVFGG
jgi:uncharacterized protein YraI